MNSAQPVDSWLLKVDPSKISSNSYLKFGEGFLVVCLQEITGIYLFSTLSVQDE